jgi:cytochrome c biogenesis protein CcmG, thiol:disulfide interchange protein DsbE
VTSIHTWHGRLTAPRILGVALVVGILTFGVLYHPLQDPSRKGEGRVGSQAPDFDVVALDGSSRPNILVAHKGYVVLLNLWATWCGPCRDEMPTLQQLYRALAPQGFRVIAVNIDGPGSVPAVRQFVHDYGLTFEVVLDSTESARHLFAIRGIPVSVLLDREGRIRGRYLARSWTTPESRRLVADLISASP